MSEQVRPRGMSYHRRKELGQARRAEYLRRLDKADDVARLLMGITLGGLFVGVMGFVARIDAVLEVFVVMIALTVAFCSTYLASWIVEREHRRRRY